MTEAGLAIIEKAKDNGSWTILDDVENLVIPDSLERAFVNNPDAREYFLSLSKSVRKKFLYWIVSAKREETKNKRIAEIIEYANQKLIPPRFI
ncbi:MAG: YdeI/OmpD-associated family protein [Marinifilaceae bacterium]